MFVRKSSFITQVTNHTVTKRTIFYKQNLPHQIENKTLEILFDNEVLQLITELTMYTIPNNNHIFRVTKDEIKVFVAVLTLSGHHKLYLERRFFGSFSG